MTKLPIRRVSMKCQVAIPMVLLRKFHIRPKGEVTFEAREDGILIKPAQDPIEAAKGMLKGMGLSSLDILKQIREEERAHERRKFGI